MSVIAIFSLIMNPLNDVVTSPNVDLSIPSHEYNIENFKIQKQHHPEVEALITKIDASEAFNKALALAKNFEDLEVKQSDPNSKTIYALATTRLMKFKDDVVIRVIHENGRTEVHMRSKSRTGRSDLGTNAKRIKNFLDLLGKNLGPKTT